MIFNIVSSLFIIIGVVFILNLTPKTISYDILSVTKKRVRLRDRVKELRTGKKKKNIGESLVSVQKSLEATGKGNRFAFVVCASLVLFVIGAVIAILIKNVFLVPVFAVFFALIPFVYVRSSITVYEKHISDEIETTLIGILAIPMIFIMPIICPVIIILSFVLYKINMKRVTKRIKQKREKIENDLPRLVATISKKISYNRSINAMLYDFMKYSGPELKHELLITVADMNSGNEEASITRLEARVGSSMMSDVCRGFITLIHGDTAEAYWATLSLKFADIQRQRLKAEANRVPKKVKKLSMSLLICFLLVYVVVIISQIMSSMNVMFG